MKITYSVDDGYAGKSRPQHVKIDDELLRDCQSMKEAKDLIWDWIEDDFRSKVSPACDLDALEPEITTAMQSKEDEE